MFNRSIVSPAVIALLLVVMAGDGFCEANAPGKPADPFAVNKLIGRGVNMGNALEAPSEGEWGVTLKEEYFQSIKEAGFDSIRLPVRWNAHALEQKPFTIDPNFFARVDWAVNCALSRNLAVMLNIHHYDGLDSDPNGHRERFCALWQQIAEHYKDKPNTLVFELMNEPQKNLRAEPWNAILKDALSVVRKSNPNRTIVIGPVNWNQINYLDKLQIPEDDRNIIVTVHYYEPMKFTHQGASWIADSNGWLGTKWLGSADEKLAITKAFDKAAEWGKKQNRPMHLGEFGAYGAEGKSDMESRARWTKFIVDTVTQRGFSFSYWEFCSGFGLYDPVKKVWHEPLMKSIVSK